MNTIHSYPEVYQLGHKYILDILDGDVLIEEKVDGSQFSFGVIDGELTCRSKRKEMPIDAPELMFSKAIETIKAIAPALRPDWIYRGEYLQKPKHNAINYGRVPVGNIVLFDVMRGPEIYLGYPEKKEEAERLDLECVPFIFYGIASVDMIRAALETESFLGNSKVEGVVVKNYNRFGIDKKILIGKYVSEAFKEVMSGEWRKANPTKTDIIDGLIAKYRTPARWQKAVQHIRDDGKLEGSPRDIGALIKEVPEDTRKECEEEIREALFTHFWPQIRRGIVAGLPEWYKESLLENLVDHGQ